MPPQLLYFGATAAVLAFIWLAQGGKAIEPAPAQHDDGVGPKRQAGGGGAPPPPYSYSYGEQAQQDTSSPYGGNTDNSSSSSSSSDSAAVASSTPVSFGTGVAGSSLPPGRGGIGVGGVVQPSPAVAQAITQVTSGGSGYSGGYTTYGSYVPATSSAGGGGATRI